MAIKTNILDDDVLQEQLDDFSSLILGDLKNSGLEVDEAFMKQMASISKDVNELHETGSIKVKDKR